VSSLSSVGDGVSSGIVVLPVEIAKIPCRAESGCRNRISIRISIRYYAAPLTSFWFLASKYCPTKFCQIDLRDRKRDPIPRFSVDVRAGRLTACPAYQWPGVVGDSFDRDHR